MSSFTLFISTLASSDPPGDGGGVCSYAFRPLLFGRSCAKVTVLDVTETAEGGVSCGDAGDGDEDVCDRFTRLAGCICCASPSFDDFEREGR